MLALTSAQDVASAISRSASLAALEDALLIATNEMGFQYYALARHPRQGASIPPMRVHNYPREWEESYDRRQLGICDPVHRASQRVACGFRWTDAHDLVPMGERDERMLEEGRIHGIEDGYTVPANIPGELSGSVTFATRVGRPFPLYMLLYAQALGGMAYQQARAIEGQCFVTEERRITDRQAEVAKWVGKGKTDWEIAQILSVSPCTISKHVRDLCARLDTSGRTLLALRAVWAGYLCFSDIFG